MKFDVVVGNPPYKQGLHMKFLQKSIEHGSIILFIHPSSVFINVKDENPQSYEIIKPIINNIVSLNFVNGNALFDIGLFVPLSITHIDKNHNNNGNIKVTTVDGSNHVFTSVNDINQFGNNSSLFSLKNKFKNMTHIMEMNNKNKGLPYKVEFTRVRGHISKDKNQMLDDDFFTIVSYDKQVIRSVESENNFELNYYFATEQEANNFLSYLKTNFARRLLSIYKTRQDLHTGEMRLIPWLDFTQVWTDDKLFKHFKLTQSEIDFINDIPDYYGKIRAKRKNGICVEDSC